MAPWRAAAVACCATAAALTAPVLSRHRRHARRDAVGDAWAESVKEEFAHGSRDDAPSWFTAPPDVYSETLVSWISMTPKMRTNPPKVYFWTRLPRGPPRRTAPQEAAHGSPGGLPPSVLTHSAAPHGAPQLCKGGAKRREKV